MYRTFIKMLFVTLLCVIAVPPEAEAQMPIKLRVMPEVPPDSADVAYYSRPHFWRAAGEVFGFNIGLWAFDRYIQKGDFAYISWNSIRENFKHGFKWDNDKLGTNMFLHPYNGSLYYNAARSNGFNFWQSSLFAVGGSAMWEMFMECEYPSTNDIIATPIGGVAIGEVCFRASDAIIDDRLHGSARFGRELAVFAISPLRSLTRILTGDAWRVRPTRGRLFGTPSVAIEFSAGCRGLFLNNSASNSAVGFCGQLDVEYGDRFEVESTKPYDYFTVRADISVLDRQPLLSQLEIKGRLIARELYDVDGKYLSVGMYQHYDYFDSDTIHGRGTKNTKVPFKLGVPASIGCGIMYRDVDRSGWVMDTYGHLNAVILGSILSDYYRVDERNYNLASGFSIKAGLNFVYGRDKFSAGISTNYYRLYTWKGYHRNTDLEFSDPRTLDAQGDRSDAHFLVTELRSDIRLWKKLYFSLAMCNYWRHTRYRDYPDVDSSSFDIRAMLTYKL